MDRSAHTARRQQDDSVRCVCRIVRGLSDGIGPGFRTLCDVAVLVADRFTKLAYFVFDMSERHARVVHLVSYIAAGIR